MLFNRKLKLLGIYSREASLMNQVEIIENIIFYAIL